MRNFSKSLYIFKIGFIIEVMNKRYVEEASNMSNYERYREQIKCLKKALFIEKKFMTIKDMSDCLKEAGFKNGTSEKTIYRRIMPDLKFEDGITKKGKYWFYDETVMEPLEMSNKTGKKTIPIKRTMLTKDEAWACIKMIEKFVETEKNPEARELLKKFTKFSRSLIYKNENSYFLY